jgi:hypothetical protein
MHFKSVTRVLSISWLLASAVHAAVDGPCRNAVSPRFLSLEPTIQLLHTTRN